MVTTRRWAVLVGVFFFSLGTFPRSGSVIPPTGTWVPVVSLTTARTGASAVLLKDGRLLIAGGEGAAGALATTELYDSSGVTPMPGASMTSARRGHSAVLLNDGRV